MKIFVSYLNIDIPDYKFEDTGYKLGKMYGQIQCTPWQKIVFFTFYVSGRPMIGLSEQNFC